MAELPLTSHEKGLLDQVQDEITEMGKKFYDCIEKCEASDNGKNQEKWMNEAESLCKSIRQRSETREAIIRDAHNRIISSSKN